MTFFGFLVFFVFFFSFCLLGFRFIELGQGFRDFYFLRTKIFYSRFTETFITFFLRDGGRTGGWGVGGLSHMGCRKLNIFVFNYEGINFIVISKKVWCIYC